jgi:polyisoprenoid-binding protein YceI
MKTKILNKVKALFAWTGKKSIRRQSLELSPVRIPAGKFLAKTALALFLVSFSFHLQAQNDYALKSIKATIQGTSTLHEWESNITKVLFKGSLQSDGKSIKSIKNVEVKVPVEGIKSKEGKLMDNKTYDAFKSEKNPYITYSFNTAQAKVDNNNLVSIETTGNLTMAGVTKPVALTAKGKVLDNGDLQLNISKKLKMTEFKMDPPTAMMGAIKVGDEVTVNFNLILSQTK